VSIVEQSSSGTTFVVDIPGVEVAPTDVDGVTYSRVSIPGAVAATLEEGKPEVPMVPVLLARPTGSVPTLRVVSMETKTLSVARLYPLQPALTYSQTPGPFVVDGNFYSGDAEYPSSRAVVVHTATWHDLDVVNVQVYPVVVRPARSEVVVTSRVTVRVDYSGGEYPSAITEWMQPMYRRLIRNYGAIGVGPGLDYHPGTRLLVICDPEYQANSELNSLLSTIQSYGYTTELMVKQPAWGSTTIKLKIKERYFDQGRVLRWVLLVGEYDEIPPKDHYTKPEWGQLSVPLSDYWYSDLNEDDLGCDDYPEIGIARLSPVAGDGGNADLSQQVQKIRDYWGGIAADVWLNKIALVAHKVGVATGLPPICWTLSLGGIC